MCTRKKFELPRKSQGLRLFTSSILAVIFAAITGCSGALAPTAIPSFDLSPSADTITVPTGANASSVIHVMSENGFKDNVSLTVSGLPSGVSATFSPATTNSTSSLNFAASSAAAPGSYTVSITGTTETLIRTARMAVTIQAGKFTLSSSAGSLPLVGGGSASSTISVIGQNGFSDNVALTASGLPSGVTAAFSPASTNTTSALTLTASSAATPGSYSVTVSGVSGSLNSFTSLTLSVSGVESTGAGGSATAIAIAQPQYGFNVIPGSVRRLYATVTGGTTNAVNWSISGGAKLSSTSGHWVDVTAPSTGSHCSINGTGPYTVTSPSSFTVTAQSAENLAVTNTIAINVCNPSVEVQVVPFYTTLYSAQKADVQAFIKGSVNQGVTWAITSQPNGGDGVLTDAANMDTVFSATVAGRYTLTATSVADGSKANTATIYVTGHYAPYQVTPSETMPVDCAVDPALTGTTYDVGPSQAYKTIASVPWTTLTPGSTIRIHNEDTAGGSPTTYHEYFQVTGATSRTQPIRVCGVPDSRGNLPVLDGSNAVPAQSNSSPYAAEQYGVVSIGGAYVSNWWGDYTGTNVVPQYFIVEGLKIQNAKSPYAYTTPSGVAGTWGDFTACVRLWASMDVVVRGIDANNCGNGLFSDFNANNGYAIVANDLYEGNHFHNNGVTGSNTEHQLYIQGWNQVTQFNVLDQYQAGAAGSNFKSRGFPDIIRYNHFGQGPSRQLDMIDNEDAQNYSAFGQLFYYSTGTITYPADLIAATMETHHADFVYGNTFSNDLAGVPIHYFSDHGGADVGRLGTLWFYNNSFYEPTNVPNWRWSLLDTSCGGGNSCASIEWPQIQFFNNAIWMDNPTSPFFQWNNNMTQFTVFGKNAINSNWGTGDPDGGDGSGWGMGAMTTDYQGASIAAGNIGIGNLIGVLSAPFDLSTFTPNAALVNTGQSMPVNGPKMPVRFQYGPSAVQTMRVQPLTMGAME